MLRSLACQLYQRLVTECCAHARLPNKLILSWRQNYENVRSKSARIPHQLSTALARIRAHAPSEARMNTASESSPAPASAAVAFGDGGGRKCEVTEESSDMIRGDAIMVKVLEDAAMDLLQVRRHRLSVLHRAPRWFSAQPRVSWGREALCAHLCVARARADLMRCRAIAEWGFKTMEHHALGGLVRHGRRLCLQRPGVSQFVPRSVQRYRLVLAWEQSPRAVTAHHSTR